MRAYLAKGVRKQFALRLKQAAPEFAEAKGESIPRGDRLYVWEVSPRQRFYLLLQFHPHEDWFTLEVAISRSGRWPAFLLQPNSPDSYVKDGDLRFRLGRLWAPPQKDVWWELAPRPPANASLEAYMNRVPVEELLSKIEPLVVDAVGQIIQHALPYFQKFRVDAASTGD